MACGLPVITTPKCGAAELLVEARSGFVRDALDVAGIAAAIDRLGPATAAALGEAARGAVLPYSPAKMAAEYVALYGRLVPG
jgi:UDP-glucose:(heptosyl)LPS alpha-1,3-glucosyltransferase